MRRYFCLLLFCITTNVLFAQKSVFVVSGYASMPLGDYGDDDMDGNKNANGASIGGGGGFKYVYSFKQQGLGLFASASLYVNAIKNSAKKKIQNSLYAVGDVKSTLYPVYFNAPLVMGLDYQIKANESVSIFVEGGVAINTLFVSKWILRSPTASATLQFAPSIQLGGVFECGVVLKQRINLGVQYAFLGNHKVNTTVESGFSNTVGNDLPFMVDLFNIGVGYRFGKM